MSDKSAAAAQLLERFLHHGIPLQFQLIPARYRRAALHFGSGLPTEVICSSLIAEAFAKVRFPITPSVTYPEPVLQRYRLGRALLGEESDEYTGLFQMRHPTLTTPRDYDLSPYFSIVKFNIIEELNFDYRKIHWEEVEAQARKAEGEKN